MAVSPSPPPPDRRPSPDRRRMARYPARVQAAVLGWREGPEFRTAAGELQDVSPGGLCVHAATAPGGPAGPAAGSRLWVRLEGRYPTAWVDAEVLAAAPAAPGGWVVRLSFGETCPYEFFKAAAFGGGAGSSPAADAADTAEPARPTPDVSCHPKPGSTLPPLLAVTAPSPDRAVAPPSRAGPSGVSMVAAPEGRLLQEALESALAHLVIVVLQVSLVVFIASSLAIWLHRVVR